MLKPYRPSNGTDGMEFMDSWCANCQRDAKEDEPCPILGASLAFQIDDPQYPKEWVRENGVPKCTAYREIGKEYEADPIPRCTKTKDMFV